MNKQNELSTTDNVIALWNDNNQLEVIKNSCAPDATQAEFQTFMQIGKATGLNPFMREIWLVKYGKNSAQIFVGRDGYRKVIGTNPNYLSHMVDAVYENDEFMVDAQSGCVNHKYNLKDRGKLMGAYCLVYMKTAPRPFFVFADIKEYNLGQSLWKTKPATMIKKVAECQAIRMAIPSELNGTYTPDEMERPVINTSVHNEKLGIDAVKNRIEEIKDIWTTKLDDSQQKLLEQLKNAKDSDELQLIGDTIQQAGLDSNLRNFFAKEYREKLNQLREENETNTEE